MERTANHDNFGLAILIFQLLFLGRHPYAGVYSGREDMPIEKAIVEYRFAYGRNAPLKAIAPPPNSVGFTVVPSEVAGLFEKAFSENGAKPSGRPGAGEWWGHLEQFEKRMRRCSADSVHSYYSGLSQCPWCRLEEHSGVLLFLSADRITKIDLKREWQKVEAITPPGPIPPVSPGTFIPRANPLPLSVQRSLDFRNFRQLAGTGLIVTCTVLFLAEMFTDPPLLAGAIVIAAALFLIPGESDGVKHRRRTDLESTRYLWNLWYKKWTAEAGDAAFHAQLSQLHELRWKYENLERGYRVGLLALEQSTKDRQQKKFLMRWSTDSCSHPRLTPAMKGHLMAAGVHSAADMTPVALRRVPQLDNTLINELLLWRERMEKNFLFDPSQGIDGTDLQTLIHKYQPMMRPVERDLIRGISKLQKIQGDILKKRVLLRPETLPRLRQILRSLPEPPKN